MEQTPDIDISESLVALQEEGYYVLQEFPIPRPSLRKRNIAFSFWSLCLAVLLLQSFLEPMVWEMNALSVHSFVPILLPLQEA